MKRLHLDLIPNSVVFIDTAGQAINHYHKEGAANWTFLTTPLITGMSLLRWPLT